MITTLKTQSALSLLLAATLGSTMASTLVVSNTAADAPDFQIVRTANGEPTIAGSRCLLGAFPGMNGAEIVSVFQAGGLDGLFANAVQVGDAFAVGDGDADAPGRIEVSTVGPLDPASPASAAVGQTPYLIVLNTPDQSNATQALVLSFPNEVFPADPEIGLDSYLAVHLRDATVVIGDIDPSGGFRAAATLGPPATDFSSWASQVFGAGAPDSDVLPLADPDRDGMNNLTEFALGLDPTTGSASPVSPTLDGSDLSIAFELRVDAPELRASIETSSDLEGPWQSPAGDVMTFSGAGSQRTDGLEHVLITLPRADAPTWFARVRFSLSGE